MEAAPALPDVVLTIHPRGPVLPACYIGVIRRLRGAATLTLGALGAISNWVAKLLRRVDGVGESHPLREASR
jgi:hypothetical protein